ncbi:MAG: HAD family phosphatase [Candidatus Doudnabacteria bacterium]
MSKKKIKAIIFDFGGVVAYGGYLDFIRHYCVECMTPSGMKKINKMEHQVNLGNISQTEFYREIAKIFHVHLTPARMHRLIVNKMQTNSSLVRLIPKLKKAKIILFSNSIGYMAAEVMKARHLSSKKLFDRVFLSNIMHLAKPDEKSYEFVLKKLKVKPAESLMVDDRIENILPAKRLGMNGIVFKNTRQFAGELKKYELI